jgi:hypothetical protein
MQSHRLHQLVRDLVPDHRALAFVEEAVAPLQRHAKRLLVRTTVWTVRFGLW